jgi:hypothetical protein
MQELTELDRDWVKSEWEFPEYSGGEYEPSVSLGSQDKVLSVDAIRPVRVPENSYRQIHEDERMLAQLIGRVYRSVAVVRRVVLQTSGIVDARSKARLFLTVKSQRGNPVQLILPRSVCTGRIPSKGDFVTYTVYQSMGDGLTHEIEIASPPTLSSTEEAAIDARIEKLSF